MKFKEMIFTILKDIENGDYLEYRANSALGDFSWCKYDDSFYLLGALNKFPKELAEAFATQRLKFKNKEIYKTKWQFTEVKD